MMHRGEMSARYLFIILLLPLLRNMLILLNIIKQCYRITVQDRKMTICRQCILSHLTLKLWL
jgi:hypothetical protein